MPLRTCSSDSELRTRTGALDDEAMDSATQSVMQRLNPRFKNLKTAVRSLSGGQRQSVAIARAVHFNAKILIMDEPTAALGPAETAQVRELIEQLRTENIGIFLISHDIHDVFDLADRISVMLQGKLVGTVDNHVVTKDEVGVMIIAGNQPGEPTGRRAGSDRRLILLGASSRRRARATLSSSVGVPSGVDRSTFVRSPTFQRGSLTMNASFFDTVDRIEFEGPESDDPLAFRWYDADRVGRRSHDA